MAEHAARLGTCDPALFADAESPERRFAAVFCLIVIGEAFNQVPAAVRALAPEIPWRAAIDMRHILVHMYWRIDFATVHAVLRNDCPSLVESLDRLSILLESTAP